MSKIIGIDLGTTNSVVAVMEGGHAKVIPTAEGANTMPSIVAVNKNNERVVGQIAKRQSVTNPKNTIYSVKRFIGRKFSDSETQEDKSRVSYEIKEGKGGAVAVTMSDKEYTPEEISAFIIGKLKADAEAKIGEKITEAVITVPAYFNDAQRQATKDAGKIAGLDVKRIINEPTAAALAYGLDKKKNEKVAVYDLGGGTFDVSVLEVGDGVVEVLSTNGNTHLGGDDFDQRLINYVADEFKKKEGIDLRKDQMALQRLKEACERAKCELSSSVQTEVNLPFITADSTGPKHLQLPIPRAKLEQLIEDLLVSSLEPCKKALADAKLKPEELDEVVLVGGSTRIPRVQELVKEFFKKEPNRSVNPDEVVAMGAAIQGAVLKGDIKDILLLDVTPLTLGIETMGGIRTPLITRNTTIPSSKKEVFSTAADSQTEVEIHILQGEREMASDNRTLGKFHLAGIPAAPRGVPKIEVTFDIDANGILNVSAKDTATGKKQSIVIEASSGLAKEEVERMVKDSGQYAEQDKQRKSLAEARNQADQLIYSSEKTVAELGDKITPDEKGKINSALERLKKAKEKEDVAEIKSAIEELTKSSHTMAQKMYEQANKQAGPGAGTCQGGDGQPCGQEPPQEPPSDGKGDKGKE